MNSIHLIGNICNELELKTTDSGKSVCSFNLAVKRPFSKDVTDFIVVVAWNKRAENICQYCHKGSRIGVSGVLTTRKWDDGDGNTRTAYEVVASDVIFLQPPSDGQNKVASTETSSTEGFGDGFIPMPSEDDDFSF